MRRDVAVVCDTGRMGGGADEQAALRAEGEPAHATAAADRDSPDPTLSSFIVHTLT